jgi:P27 family predicted phage terminase small subunit
MGRRGPKPQPTALKLARGNPGKRALPPDEPALSAGPCDVPEGMDGRARDEWHRLVGELTDKGVLTVGDLKCFEEYCYLVAEIAEMRALMKKVGLEKSIDERYPHILDKLRSQKARHEAQLGLTPSSRSGVKAVKPMSAKDTKLTRFFGTKPA